MKRKAFLYLCLILVLAFSYDEPLHAQQKKAARPSPSSKARINFVDVELATFAKFISDTTGINLLFDERLKGKITIMAPEGMSKGDILELFSSVLDLKGFTLVPVDNAFKIVPSPEAKQKSISMQSIVNDSYTIKLVPLNYIAPEDASRFLAPLVSRDGYMAPFPQGNYLLLIDTGLNIEKITDILDIIDTQPQAEQTEIVTLNYASSDELARILNEGIQGAERRPGGPRAIAEPRLNAIILVGSTADKERMKNLIQSLDVPGAEVQGGINVYFLEHANAEDLAKTLQGLVSGQRPGQQRGQTTTIPGQQPIPQGQAPAGQQTAGAISEKINITPDKATNSLVIMASQIDYQNLVAIIRKLDQPRRQVFVEAMIVEASLDNLRDLGTKWRGTALDNGSPVVIGGVGTIDSNSVLNIISGLSGLTVGGMGNFFDVPVTRVDSNGNITQQTLRVPGFAALFSLSEFRNAVNVLSTPQILTSDNQEAEIVVGQNVPFIISSNTATSGLLVSNTIQRMDVGIKLRITPHITEGDSVRLDIYQEISAVQPPPAGTEVAILTQVGPTTTMRSTKTAVTVNNEQTIVIGGLISESHTDIVNKVPVLGDIPLLGYLFKNKSIRKQKTNLLVFISPKIIKSSNDIQQISERKEAEFKETKHGYKEGELIVKFKDGVPEEEARSIIAVHNGQVISRPKEKLFIVKITDNRSVPEAVQDFSALPEVKYAEPNYILKLDEK